MRECLCRNIMAQLVTVRLNIGRSEMPIIIQRARTYYLFDGQSSFTGIGDVYTVIAHLPQ